ncbi:DNA polymerase-3 subunit epsilon [Tamilnaduibacter salinus]|uniref:DNA polymerase-3 subunit epsilon n=1 Tax=Tamilnaduibacter salinus TaxID=1484056 RepID=A0A2U1CTC9_9GAMM|nr:3'-5' exonuclease [Tamilnaduibacter salinus]PVY69606.1 DNA polymerase-3 subunit epsilon [Tamilnaduibacter salinus]
MLERFKDWFSRQRHQRPSSQTEEWPVPGDASSRGLSTMRLIVLDLETTGLNPSRDQVIAIGAVAIEALTIPMRDQVDLILRRPELDIRETVLIHGIGPEALRSGHETEDALHHLLMWMNGDPILAFHSAFDQSFLEKLLRQQLDYRRRHTWLDVAELLPALYPERRATRLDEWIEQLGLTIDARHHAAADALVTAELTLMALHRGLKDDLSTFGALTDKLRDKRRLKRFHNSHLT